MSTRRREILSKRGKVSAEEWEARVELAATYRLVAHFGWTNLVTNHISLRVPGTTDQFLINPFGLLYEQITASSLIRIDTEGNRLEDSPHEVNQAGFVIHSTIHAARLDLHCVLHTHTVAGQAVSALERGLLPLNQSAMRFYNRVGYHDLEGIALDTDERERLVRDLGPHKVLILRHHGLLTAGINCAEAFSLMYHLEKCCLTQMMVVASREPHTLPPQEVCEHTAQQYWRGNRALGQREWPALMDMIEAASPGFAN
jgi:ribulose-5-phosphate 4-epimerase/fuculose-1-phosphate aldolase